MSLVAYHAHQEPGVPEYVIYRIKSKDDELLLSYLAEELAVSVKRLLGDMGVPWQDAVVSFPPRRPKSIQKYGFDQAESVARRLARCLGGKSVCLFERTEEGQSSLAQKKLTAAQRQEVAKLSYALRKRAPRQVAGRVVLLVDDIYTTGATLRSCAELLVGVEALLVVLVTVGKTAEQGGHGEE